MRCFFGKIKDIYTDVLLKGEFCMANSMTGYGRSESQIGNLKVTAELKTVNHRYFEASVKLPKCYAFAEDKVISFLKTKISRGKTEVYISIETVGDNSLQIDINEDFAQKYINTLKLMAKKYKIKNDISVMSVAANSDIFKLRKPEVNEEEVTAAILEVLNDATEKFLTMRKIEGKRLCEDISERCDFISEKIAFIESRSAETVANYRERLEQKIRDLLNDANVDEQRIITETAVFADKIAVDEETVRLKSHILQLKDMLRTDESVGRKLDFIVQEMNRETNTIGSKAQNIEITNTVVDIKAEIEKIREQIQNIE